MVKLLKVQLFFAIFGKATEYNKQATEYNEQSVTTKLYFVYTCGYFI